MKRTILLTLAISLFLFSTQAQKTARKITAYAITAVQKGQNNWTEVRLIDVHTGEVLETIYQSTKEITPLNARTGKPIAKKEADYNTVAVRKVVNLDLELERKEPNMIKAVRKVSKVSSEKPFATNSAACALDRKHDRLYYTPMGIPQLRYIDLKSGNIYYFEDETFGALSGPRDVPNQITRMVIASDGNGYALTNNAEHLIRFTTGKKPVITDLGGLTDDPNNGTNSVRSGQGYGGDIIADDKGSIYLFTANRRVFKIDLESRVATFKGTIKGLPGGYSTNAAIVEGGSTIVVGSANSTLGYYRFDINTLLAEKISGANEVYNVSDLANSNFVAEKKKKKKQEDPPAPAVKQDVAKTNEASRTAPEQGTMNKISVYPNPVTNGLVKLSFEDQPLGNYVVHLIDISGKLISTQTLTIQNKFQVEEFRLPALISKGNYVLKIEGEQNKVLSINQIAVQ